MIGDPAVLEEIRMSWKGVDILREKTQRALLGSIAQGASAVIMIDACSVLNEVLQQLALQGQFKCKSRFLGSLLEASREDLAWKDFSLMKECVARRKDLAHRGEILPRANCWKYIDGIKNELLHWGVLNSVTGTCP